MPGPEKRGSPPSLQMEQRCRKRGQRARRCSSVTGLCCGGLGRRAEAVRAFERSDARSQEVVRQRVDGHRRRARNGSPRDGETAHSEAIQEVLLDVRCECEWVFSFLDKQKRATAARSPFIRDVHIFHTKQGCPLLAPVPFLRPCVRRTPHSSHGSRLFLNRLRGRRGRSARCARLRTSASAPPAPWPCRRAPHRARRPLRTPSRTT